MVCWISPCDEHKIIQLEFYPIVTLNRTEHSSYISFCNISGKCEHVVNYAFPPDAIKDFESIKELLLNTKTS